MSSKINEHDLEDSVFEGLALEETSQKIYNLLGGDNAGESSGGVAKAEDVQEILGKVSEISEGWSMTKVVSGELTTSAKEVLSVQGKGALHAFSQLHQDGISTVKIVVDGKTIVNGKMTGSNSSYPVLLHVGNPSDVTFVADGSNTKSGACSPVLNGAVGTAYGLYSGGAKGLSEEQWTDSRNGIVLYVPLVKAITFEESLVITCKGSITRDKYGCLYELR